MNARENGLFVSPVALPLAWRETRDSSVVPYTGVEMFLVIIP